MLWKSLIVLGLSALAAAHRTHQHKRQETRDLSHCSRSLRETKAKRSPDLERRMDLMHGEQSIAKRSTLEQRAIFTELANNTCVINPEVTSGPYHIDGELYRRDIRDGEPGVPLWMDIGIIDIDTCEPLPGVFLEFWHCNSTGYYSSYTGIDPDTMQYTLPTKDDGTTDDLTFLRGWQVSDENGIAEFLTIFPGWYSPRAVHVHVIAHIDATLADNGTLIGGEQVHVGQLFFDEDLTYAIHNTSPYTGHSQTRRPSNDHDQVYPQSNTTAWYPVVEIVQLGKSYGDGLLGYITIAVSTTGNTTTSDPGLHTGGGSNPTNTIAASLYPSASAHDASQLAVEASATSLQAAFSSAVAALGNV
ncbi:aromatic compound dioxygenase [Desarmillaria tabescens]|uniref:Aromatic compound dioxygenase n=1 Tax=Armillaria tabescens TaxID=1929756 RepID=A0AA39N7E3_ARMTA|nr:aromatic compound dioxygenase [Desarmillaria tabescens]KAK0460383.1 aromatic compound dioxygenase [Desarmillaria tabescens]